MDKFWKWLTIALLAFVFIGVLLHAYGFSLAAGTLFTGFNQLGQTLEAPNVASGGTRKR